MYPLYCLIPSLICKNKHIDIIEYYPKGASSLPAHFVIVVKL